MVKTSQKTNLKRWKRKFLGINEEGTDATDDVYSKAQRLINIFRQLSVLNKDAIEKYNDMLLNVSSDVRAVLSTLPCGMDVRGYISYLQERRGLPIEEDDEEDDEEMRREREKAKVLADAISQSTSRSAEAMQKQTMEQMEKLTKVLAEAQSRNATPEELARISMNIQSSQNTYENMPSSQEPAVPAQLPVMRRAVKDGEDGDESLVYYQDPSDISSSIGKAVADAIVQSQQKTSEIISGMLADALSKPQQVQNDSLKEISEMLANSQEKTANIILASFGDAISRPQQVQNEGLRELADSLLESNHKSSEAIILSLKEGMNSISNRSDSQLKEIVNSLQENNRNMIEAVTNAFHAAVARPEEYENEAISRIAGLVAASQEQTARVILDAFSATINRPDERRNDEIRLLTDVIARAVDLLSQPHATSDEMMLRFLEAQEHNSMMLARVIETLTGIKEEPETPDDEAQMADSSELSEPLYGGFDESEFKPVVRKDKQTEFFEINEEGYPVSSDGSLEPDFVSYDSETTVAASDGLSSELRNNDSPTSNSLKPDIEDWVNDKGLSGVEKEDLYDYSSFFADGSDFLNEKDEDLMQIIPELPVVKKRKNKKKSAGKLTKKQKLGEVSSASVSAGISEGTSSEKKMVLKASSDNAAELTVEDGVIDNSEVVKAEKTVSDKKGARGENKFWVKDKSKKNRKKGGSKPFVILPDEEEGGFTKIELG